MTPGALDSIIGRGRVLLAAAAPAEARAVVGGRRASGVGTEPWAIRELDGGFDLVETGIGKVNAAGAVARLLDRRRHAAVLSVGIAGCLPRDVGALSVGTVVLASASVYADEGVEVPGGFVETSDLGFPLGPFEGRAVAGDPGLLRVLEPVAGVVGPIATVSTCSGTDRLARQVVARTGAVAEGMEGAAVAHVAARLGIPCAELRVISNTTGDRSSQSWDVAGALAVLAGVIGRL